MATGSGDLMEWVDQCTEEGPFKPYAYYGAEEDSLTVYFKDDADYAKRLNSRVTVFLSLEDNELVGFQIKSVRYVLQDIGWFPLRIDHKKVRVDGLFLAYRGDFEADEDSRELYKRIGAEVARSQLEADVPESATVAGA